MTLLLQIEELRAGVALLAACLEAAVDETGPKPEEIGPPEGADFLRAYA